MDTGKRPEIIGSNLGRDSTGKHNFRPRMQKGDRLMRAVAAEAIPYGWQSTGEPLSERAADELFDLVFDAHRSLSSLDFKRWPKPSRRSFDFPSERKVVSQADLDQHPHGLRITRLLRTRRSKPYQGEVQVEIGKRP